MRNSDVISAHNNKEEQEFLFFYGHSGKRDKVDKSCLSQWYDKSGNFEDHFASYQTCEHFMMVGKSLLMNPNDVKTVDKMLEAGSPGAVKKMGRAVKNYDQLEWDTHKFDLVVQGNYLKFSQDEELKEFLLDTGDKIFVEASPFDKIWGIGMKSNETGVVDPNNWKGVNLLGYALMEVRKKLRDEEE